MVNVGGRSKGCSTCRRRRVKCDETRPICQRCARCGFDCDGAKSTAFVKAKIVKSRRSENPTKCVQARDKPGRGCDNRELSLPTLPVVRGFDIQIIMCYTRKTLFRGGPVDLALRELQSDDIRPARNRIDDNRLLHCSILSLAVIFFGSQHRQTTIMNYGYLLHGIALNQLNSVMSNPTCYLRDDVLLSVVTMALLECFVPTGRKYYLKHMIGLEKLLELRGPTMDGSSKSNQVYKGIRRMLLFASLSTRKPSILARDEWKNVLRLDSSNEEVEEQDLFDALADCTVLIADGDTAMMNLLPNATRQRDEVTRKALDLLARLYAWRRRWETNDRNFQFEHSHEAARTPPMHRVYDENAAFSSSKDSAVITLMLYHTVLIYVFGVLSSISSEILSVDSNLSNTVPIFDSSEPAKEFSDRPKEEYFAAKRGAALHICRFIPYHLVRKSRMDAGSLTVAHLAIRTAWQTLGGNDSLEGRSLTDFLSSKNREVFAKGLWVD